MDEFLLTVPDGTRIYSRHGFLSLMLPYIEQANVLTLASGGYNFHKDWNDPANQPAASVRIPTYECPSVPSQHFITPVPTTPVVWTNSPATGDYWPVSRANNNSAVWLTLGFAAYPGPDGVQGVLTANARTNIMAIPDGLSNTIMVGESGARHEGWAAGKKYADASTVGWGVRGAWASESNNIVCAGTQGPIVSGAAPAGKVSTAAHVPGAISINGWNQGELYGFHPGLCMVVMGDGSVRSLRDNISLAALQKLAARADGNPNDAD